MYKVQFKGMPQTRQETDNNEHRTYSGCNDQTSAGAIPDLLRPEMLDAFDRETFGATGIECGKAWLSMPAANSGGQIYRNCNT